MTPKSFAREHVAQMHFDERHGHCEKGVAQGNAGVRIARRIDDHERDALVLRGLDLRKQVVLRVALVSGQAMPLGTGQTLELCLDALQAGRSVDLRLTET